ncbi:Uncharacterized protein SAMN03097699_0061 [Flavobacteriaceae bacterium MAR_2010_188]|nr:Uncharacterized protein SAMN03097699_0061 [Flavobacteriaceae bacterium MAR_2010_188]
MKIIKLIAICLLLLPITSYSQKKKQNTKPDNSLNDSLFHGLKWRNIGPFRGGRSVTSTGVVGEPMTYYFGSVGGGVWKTTDDGINWKNVSDGFFETGTVGDIAVSESNPNLVVVGMGEHAARGVMTSMGDGVYKSTDAGKTWKHMGLDKSRHISDVIINPNNPDNIFVAVQGAQYGPSADRGIYRSMNGGTTWEKVLYVNDITGASSLSMDFKNPLILYASMWQHERKPWTITSGGKNSGLYKSTDGGTTWEQMKKGLPEEFGKSGISVSRANPDRVFAVIEAEDKKGGVYRSDDAGKTWAQVNSDRVNITRSWYYMEIFADPQNENIVYVLNAPVMKSIDGGKTFSNVEVPHGDNHDLWINPNDNSKMINSNDGGANISNNGGKSWSTQENQPTAQFYRVITDNLMPYNVYGGQQDNSAIAISSRTNGEGIGWKDWYSVAGCESAFLAFDPDNPDDIYGGCYQGIIEKWRKSTQEGKAIKEYPELSLSGTPKDFKYRYNWNAPIISSPHNRSVIYHGGNVVFKTTDGGLNWEAISPDLTKNEKGKQGPGGGPYTNEAAGGENYNTLTYLAESPHEEGFLWAGSDDGLLHMTRDGGKNWTNVTPSGVDGGIINSIEVSPHDKATAYITVMRYKEMDLSPYIFKTTDYGKSWKKIVNGITGDNTFARVVREDKNVKGQLYAGTETGLYISTNDGENWQKFQSNLPVVPINDLTIQNNDLVVATAGRSFWILDDVVSLQNIVKSDKALELFKPNDTSRFYGRSMDQYVSGLGQNPKQGVAIDYYIGKEIDSTELKLEIMENNKVIKTITNKKQDDFKSWPGGPSKPEVLSDKKGYNRFVWDFTTNPLPAVENVFAYGSYGGAGVAPGTYKLKMTYGDNSDEKMVKVTPNPNVKATEADYAEQRQFLTKIDDVIVDIHESVQNMRSAQKQLKDYKKLLKDNEKAKELVTLGDSLIKRIDRWEQKLIQPNQKTFQDVINFQNQLNAEFMELKSYASSSEPALTSGAKLRYDDLMKEWNTYVSERNSIINDEMAKYNSMYNQLGLPAIIMPEE